MQRAPRKSAGETPQMTPLCRRSAAADVRGLAGAQVVAPRMLTQRRGNITNISSLAARVGCEGRAAYSSSKGGVELHCADRVLTDMEKKAWDAEEKSAPVKVRIPPHRLGTPLEIADLYLFLTS